MVRLPAASLAPFAAFTCYNSPYSAHDDASAIDLYPPDASAPSPVAGEVVACHRVRAPRRPYAREFDYVIAIDTGAGDHPLHLEDGTAAVARVLHVEPQVSVGDRVDRGESLGRPLRAGFFAPWVANHLHVDVRPPSTDLRRAGGAVSLSVEADVAGIPWDGRGRVVATGRTFAELAVDTDAATDAAWVGLAGDDGGVLDGGLPHYDHGGRIDRLLGNRVDGPAHEPVRLLGTLVGTARGPTITWDPVRVLVNDRTVTGLSLFCARPSTFRVKLVGRGHGLSVGDEATVEVLSR